MKMVVAIIRHERLQEVQDVLDECGVSGVTVTEVKGCGAQRGYTEKYRGTAVHISLRPRLKIEAVMRAEIVKTVFDKMAVAARIASRHPIAIFAPCLPTRTSTSSTSARRRRCTRP